jgi:branched-subunit amino acid transport protein
MNTFFLIISMAAVVYACRLSGFVLRPARTGGDWQAYLQFVPIAVFSAFVVPDMLHDPGFLGIKVAALAVAGGVVWRTHRAGFSIVLGLGVLWLFTLVVGE